MLREQMSGTRSRSISLEMRPVSPVQPAGPSTWLTTNSQRRLGSGTLADNAVTQQKLAEMALLVDASALLIYRAAWQQDVGGVDHRRAAVMAKLHATEAAQQVIDAAVQMHGGVGATRGVKVRQRLYAVDSSQTVQVGPNLIPIAL